MIETNILILGAGPSGLGCASELYANNIDFLVLDKENQAGGLMRSYQKDGFTFDIAGHIFFSRLPEIKELFIQKLDGNLNEVRRHSKVKFQEKLVDFPFQAHLRDLPVGIRKKCLLDFIENFYREKVHAPENFEEWIFDVYGKGIADYFMLPYNRKLWTYDLKKIALDWIEGRIAHPAFEEVIEGALEGDKKDLGDNAVFYYPLHGGINAFIQSYSKDFSDRICLNETVLSVDLENKIVKTSVNAYHYQQLVSTLPLPAWNDLTAIPGDVQESLDSLLSVSVYCLNIGAKKTVSVPYHWYYFPEDKYVFHRIFVQSNMSPFVAPDDCNGFTVEISYSEMKKLNRDQLEAQTIQGLLDAGMIRKAEDICFVEGVDIPFGYVVYTLERLASVQKVRQWLATMDTHLVGRYATWDYYNMDHAIAQGQKLAARFIKTC